MKCEIKKIIVCLLYTLSVNAQENKNWIIGTGVNLPITLNRKIEFSNNGLILTNTGTHNRMSTTSTCISDTNGNLLFYTNGLNVYDANGDTMVNGTGLSPSYWSALNWNDGLDLIQAVVAIPVPGSETAYYLIHSTFDSSIFIPIFPYHIYYGTKLYYSVIDMTGNGGLGEIIQKNTNILPALDTIGGRGLTCCRHANGRDWWLLEHGYNNNEYLRWLITPNGFQGPFKQSIAPAAVDIPYGLSQCKFSPDGKKFASVIDYTKNDSIHTMWLYNFNRCTGLLDSAIELNYTDIGVAVGCEFSSNSEVLYANTLQYLNQWNLQAANIPQSKLIIDTVTWYFDSLINSNWIGYFWLLQKATDNKIYMSTKDATSVLHCINYPDSIGLSCNFVQQQVQLPCYNFQSIPNQVYFGLGAEVGSVCDTLTGIAPLSFGEGLGVRIFPNPAFGRLNIETDALIGDAEIFIYNLLGEKCFTSKTKNAAAKITLDVAVLKQGLYLLQIKTRDKVWSKKFFKE